MKDDFDEEGAVESKNLSVASFLAHKLYWRPSVQFMFISGQPAGNWTKDWLSQVLLYPSVDDVMTCVVL
jgi:hypothetical protein